MANHRANGRAHMRPLATAPRGQHRDRSALSAGAVKVGVLGALVTATIAVPVASATASQTGLAASLPTQVADVSSDAASVAEPTQTASDQSAAASTAPVALPAATAAGADDTQQAEVSAKTITLSSSSSDSDVEASAGSGWAHPVQGPITSNYGWRIHPTLGYRKLHDGVDYGVACGTPVHAAKSGTVVKAQNAGSSGNRVDIDHGNGVVTGYFHLQSFSVKVGDKVTTGQTVGAVGSTGRSTGCHMHFAKMDTAGNYSDPLSLFS